MHNFYFGARLTYALKLLNESLFTNMATYLHTLLTHINTESDVQTLIHKKRTVVPPTSNHQKVAKGTHKHSNKLKYSFCSFY